MRAWLVYSAFKCELKWLRSEPTKAMYPDSGFAEGPFRTKAEAMQRAWMMGYAI